MSRHINAPMTKEEIASLKAGDYVYPTGTIYTAGDAAHKRMGEALDRGEALSFDIEGNIIYYMGPSPAKEGRPIGSTDPAAASRMDKYTPRLLDLGMGTMVGKGKRSRDVMDTIVRGGAAYFAAMGGAGAILSECVLSSEIVTYEDLGTEAVRRLTVQDFPVVIVMGTLGNDLYETTIREFCALQRGDMRWIIYVVLMNLLHAPIWLSTIARMTREKDTRAAAEKYRYISEMVKRINRRGRVTVTAAGTKYIPSGDGFILSPNHQGLPDILALFSTCPGPLSVVIKKEASNWILVKQVLGATKSLAMNGDSIRDQVRIIAEVTKLVKSGRNFVIFAEGHRSRNGSEILDFKNGAFKSAVKVGCPIVPVALIDSFQPFDMNPSKRGGVQVCYMKPTLPGQYMEMRTSEIAYLVHDRIQEEIDKNLTQDDLTS